jgi:hypothetical protein
MSSVPTEMIEAMRMEHRLELAKREMQLVRYRQALLDHGIEPPDADGEELLAMWEECRHVVTTASEFVMRLGSQKELLVDWRAA